MKKKYFIAILIGIFAFVISCSFPKEPLLFMIDVKIFYKDKLGRDLFNIQTPNNFDVNKISLYLLKNGKRKLIPHFNESNTNSGYSIYKYNSTGDNLLFFYIEADSIIIELNNQITDTLVSEIIRHNREPVRVNKIWYNGIIMWDNYSGKERIFTIVK